jgi:hypothetical protein
LQVFEGRFHVVTTETRNALNPLPVYRQGVVIHKLKNTFAKYTCKKYFNGMTHYRYSAADIEHVTSGFVTLKAINNWVNAKDWFSPLEPASRGRSRMFSRMNLIEAGIARAMMVAGISRKDAKNYMLLKAAALRSGGYVDDLPSLLEASPPFVCGSAGWVWVLTFSEHDGLRELDGIYDSKVDELAGLRDAEGAPVDIAALATAVIIIPVSGIVARVDALDDVRGKTDAQS